MIWTVSSKYWLLQNNSAILFLPWWYKAPLKPLLTLRACRASCTSLITLPFHSVFRSDSATLILVSSILLCGKTVLTSWCFASIWKLITSLSSFVFCAYSPACLLPFKSLLKEIPSCSRVAVKLGDLTFYLFVFDHSSSRYLLLLTPDLKSPQQGDPVSGDLQLCHFFETANPAEVCYLFLEALSNLVNVLEGAFTQSNFFLTVWTVRALCDAWPTLVALSQEIDFGNGWIEVCILFS